MNTEEFITMDEVVEITENPTVAELQAQILEQKKASEQREGLLNRKLEEAKKLKEELTSKTGTPIVKESEVDPLELSFAMSKLSTTLSYDEIQLAKSYVGTGLGKTLLAVSETKGFKAILEEARDKAKSDEMIGIEDFEIKPIETKMSTMRAIADGQIDMKKDKDASKLYMNEYVAALKKERRG